MILKFSLEVLWNRTSVSNKYNADLSDPELWLKMFALLYAYDTVFMSESELNMQKALDATAEYWMENNMKIIVAQTKFMVTGKIRNLMSLCMVHQLNALIPFCIWELVSLITLFKQP